MDRPSFVYVTYIETTPEKVWHALLDNDITKQYWANHYNKSDWKVGSKWRHEDCDNPSRVDIVGTVLENEPFEKLVISWVAPEDEANESKYSRVTFDLAVVRKSVRLTVTHENLEPNSRMLKGISEGWPAVLSSLKTLLETGKALELTATRWESCLA
jgi:uncharacterized protein YndB with AHSA1/START domain